LLRAEGRQLLGGKVGAEVVDMPVALAQRHRRHHRGEHVAVAGQRCHRRRAAPAPSRRRVVLTEDPLHDRARAVLDRDARTARAPLLTDAGERRDEQLLRGSPQFHTVLEQPADQPSGRALLT